jgi:hypothetical protein
VKEILIMPAGRPRADRQLAHCREEGHSCEDCVKNAALSLSRVAEGMPTPVIRRMFNSMFPHPTCMTMAGQFVQIVAEQQEAPVRRMPQMVVPLRYAVAVA